MKWFLPRFTHFSPLLMRLFQELVIARPTPLTARAPFVLGIPDVHVMPSDGASHLLLHIFLQDRIPHRHRPMPQLAHTGLVHNHLPREVQGRRHRRRQFLPSLDAPRKSLASMSM